MDILTKIANEYRCRKNYGVTFSIEPEAYNCDIPSERIEFGNNTTVMQGGRLYNFQDVFIDGNIVGYLEESMNGKLFDPMTVTFAVILADCTEPEKVTDEMRKSPHFWEDETFEFRFATLQQMVDYLRKEGTIC